MHTAAPGTPARDLSPRFTPGPWRRIGHRLIVTTRGAGLPICNVLPGGVGAEQADANERLIAAAPAMLEALRVAVDSADYWNGENHFDPVEQILRATLELAQGDAA